MTAEVVPARGHVPSAEKRDKRRDSCVRNSFSTLDPFIGIWRMVRANFSPLNLPFGAAGRFSQAARPPHPPGGGADRSSPALGIAPEARALTGDSSAAKEPRAVFVTGLQAFIVPLVAIGLLILANKTSHFGKHKANLFENIILVATTILTIWVTIQVVVGWFTG